MSLRRAVIARARSGQAIAVLALTLFICAGCSKPVQLPADPGLLRDDLGLGITLGMDKSAVRTAAETVAKQAQVLVLTREEFSLRDPYAERRPNLDLLVALYSEVDESGIVTSPLGIGSIEEIRCYLAAGDKSALKLLGRSLALLNAPQAEEVFGAPYSRDSGADGQTHLTYFFTYAADSEKDADAPPRAIKLVLSFNATGACYAADLGITAPPLS